MVVQAVQSEPVSAPKFPMTGKFTRNFVKILGSRRTGNQYSSAFG